MATGSASDVDFEKIDFESLLNMKNYISKGSFGAVHGPITLNSREFAVKLILIIQNRHDEDFKTKVKRKKTIWTSLKHEHLIEIHFVSVYPKAVYITMEYASGGSLRQLLDKSDVEVDILNWARQIAEGMLYLHEKKLVHRDLKSSNIVLMEPFHSLNAHVATTLKITDFDNVQEHAGTTTTTFSGTFAYMAPEVLKDQRFSKASDVWSYGVVLWEMFTKELPHNGQAIGPLVAKAISGQLTLSVPESIFGVFKELLCECWCQDRKNRPPFKDIIHRLNSVCENKDEGHVVMPTLKQGITEMEDPVNEIEESGALRDKLRSAYKSDPVLVHSIRTEAVEKKSIFGLTILYRELFVLSQMNPTVEVYDSIKFSFSRQWNLKELSDPKDIVSCNKNKCLYIFDYKSKEMLRVNSNGDLIKNWSTGDDYGHGLSVTDESNVIFTVYYKNKLNEYSPDGQLIREINLSSDAGIRRPWHAIKLTNGHFVVSHGYFEEDLHRVSIVNADGKLEKSFGGKLGSNNEQMNHPAYLCADGNEFVMVADRKNGRILLLDSDLEFKKEIVWNEEKHGLPDPRRILLDESNGRLFVADNGWDSSGRILIFNI